MLSLCFINEYVNIETFFDQENISKIDLMKINIEGGEYDLLEFLIKKDLVKIRNIPLVNLFQIIKQIACGDFQIKG